ncbi:VOC family protein [Streptomyces luteolus]|uniref:VOC family protein n=1 Tax=Streptomyces luteolus TaxID=3043615 RepID=A0ABT6SUY6_9ACTN|nr:VOC family protein [Streptomyces sp. B-S-A12]MDI3419035.1 VOC family protein [Streptomyces sp. B-S-A12]
MAAVNYFEIGSPDPQAARRFYGSLFKWNFGDPDQGYQMINNGQGGLWDSSAAGGAHWAIFYVQVDDVQEVIGRAEELGATVAVPLVDGGSLRFAHLVDPEGNRFAVWQPKPTV